MKKWKVLYIAAECKPFSKMGGVADVAGELPPALKKLGVDIEIVTPLYGVIDSTSYDNELQNEYSFPFKGKNGKAQVETVQIYLGELNDVPVNLLRNKTYFEGKYSQPYIHSEKIAFYDDVLRFSFFSEACLQLIKDKNPDIVHINDWVLGYLFGRMVMEGMTQKRVLTVHNIGYQGNIGQETIRNWEIARILNDGNIGHLFIDPRIEWNSVNALRLGLELSHKVHTVSPNYCEEITKPEDQNSYFEGGKGLHEVTKRLYDDRRLVGILNGFEYTFEPTHTKFAQILKRKAEMKKALSEDFSDSEAFLLGFVGRAVEQKFKLLTEVIDGKSVLEHMLDIPRLNVAIVATGLPEYETFLRGLERRDNCSITLAFDRNKARQISIGSDVFLMPSLFEPCGITQMESLSNATPPLVRWTGGLVDTVIPHSDVGGTGFGFGGSTRDEVLRNLINTVTQALELYREKKKDFSKLQKCGFNQRFLWSDTAEEYVKHLYQPVLN